MALSNRWVGLGLGSLWSFVNSPSNSVIFFCFKDILINSKLLNDVNWPWWSNKQQHQSTKIILQIAKIAAGRHVWNDNTLYCCCPNYMKLDQSTKRSIIISTIINYWTFNFTYWNVTKRRCRNSISKFNRWCWWCYRCWNKSSKSDFLYFQKKCSYHLDQNWQIWVSKSKLINFQRQSHAHDIWFWR